MVIDAALVAAAREGDTAASEQLLLLTRSYAVRWARVRVDDDATADDVAQDAMLEAWQTLSNLRSSEAYLAWVRLLVTKHAERHRRARRPVLALDLLEIADSGEGPADVVSARDQDAIVRRSLGLAPDADRRLLDLRYYEGWSDADLAALLGITAGAVRKRLFDARRRLMPGLSSSLDRAHTRKRAPMPTGFGTVTHVTPDHAITTADFTPVPDDTPLNTGVRVLDALLPWPRAGLIELRGPANTGAMVLLGEVLTGLHRLAPAALVAVTATAEHSPSGLELIVTDPDGQPERSMAFTGDPRGALTGAAQAAGQLARTGVTTLLAVDELVSQAVGLELLAQLPLALAHGSVTVIRCAVWDRTAEPIPAWKDATSSVTLSRELAALGIYPAVDLLHSRSRLADPDLAGRARERLTQAQELHQWISQPFVTAEAYTGIAGQRLTAHQALTQLQAVLA